MHRKLGKDLENLLFQVRRGSLDHLSRLVNTWPEHANIPAGQAALSLLSLERQPRNELGPQDFELAQKALLAVTKAMHVAEAVQPHTRKAVLDLIVPKLDGMISWMSLCIRQLPPVDSEDDVDEDDIIRDEHDCIRLFGSLFMTIMHYDPQLRSAMQASATAAAFVALIWTWTDKTTGLPLFMPAADPEWTKVQGCVTNIALCDYTEDSETALENVFQHLSHDGEEYSAANTFVEVGLSRLRRIRQACENSEPGWEPMVIGRNVKLLLSMFNQVLKLGLPEVLHAFQQHSGLRQIMSTMRSLAYALRSHDNRMIFFLLGFLVLDPILDWASLPGVAPLEAARQLVEGGMVAFIVDVLAYGPHEDQDEKEPGASQVLCRTLFSWVSTLCFYPSVYPGIREAVLRADERPRKEMMDRLNNGQPDGIWKMAVFFVILKATEVNENVQEEGRPRICDNAFCPSAVNIILKGRLRECSRCHSVIYCSKICQQFDWRRSHQEDCPHLQREYFGRYISLHMSKRTESSSERKACFTWVHASTRLYHLVLLQEYYKMSLQGLHLEAARQKTHPLESLSDLVVTYDFVNFTVVVEEHPQLSTVREFLGEWGGFKEEGRLGEIGGRRLEDAVDQFVSNAGIRLVVGIFRLNDNVSLLTVCRIHAAGELDEICAIGGFSAVLGDLGEDT